jgi:hypothetical protein
MTFSHWLSVPVAMEKEMQVIACRWYFICQGTSLAVMNTYMHLWMCVVLTEDTNNDTNICSCEEQEYVFEEFCMHNI